MDAVDRTEPVNAFSCELEDWFHILDSDRTPAIEEWSSLPLCAEKNVDRLLELFDEHGVRATFFCLGWMAERMPDLVRRCRRAGHEIGSHGYAHLLSYEVGPNAFLQDLVHSKKILEDITGEAVIGFRSPGFAVTNDNRWVFDVVAEAGYKYDASVFPAYHGHGGLCEADPAPHMLKTSGGSLIEIPSSTIKVWGRPVCLFGGGYLRVSPLPLIRWGIRRLHREGRPLVVYIHPREIDPKHPRLRLNWKRRFKCYVNLRSTWPKIAWLCKHYQFTTMRALAERLEPIREEKSVEVGTPKKRRQTVTAVDVKRRPQAAEQVHFN